MRIEGELSLLMLQDRIIAAQQECEEIFLQSDPPDYRALYFRLFARMEDVRTAADALLRG